MRYFLSFILLFFYSYIYCQSIEGYVLNENNEPVTSASVYVQNTNWGTSTNNQGYFYIRIAPGTYDLTISSVGYKSKSIPVIVQDEKLSLKITLEISTIELDDIIVRFKRKDPAYEIMELVIANKHKYLKETGPYQCDIYLKATEDTKDEEKKEDLPLDRQLDNIGAPMESAFEDDTVKQVYRPNINLLEQKFILCYQPPGNFKELHEGRKRIGNVGELYIPVFQQNDFNFYKNLVSDKKVSDVQWISPLHGMAILSYKYKLEEAFYEGAQLVYKIKVTPRKKGNSTLEGTLYINHGLYNIRKLELTAGNGGARTYDEFTVKQEYRLYGKDSSWLLEKEAFEYKTKFRRRIYEGSTVLVFQNYELNKEFPDKFFNNEVARYAEDADDKDSLYWKEARADTLSSEQLKAITYTDSAYAAENSAHYLDSMDNLYNKVKVVEILYEGLGFRNRKSKQWIRYGSLVDFVEPFSVGGPRLGPRIYFQKTFESGKSVDLSLAPNIGIKNKDVKGTFNVWHIFNPINHGVVNFGFNKAFLLVNPLDSYLSRLSRQSYYEGIQGHVFLEKAIFTGLRFNTRVVVSERRPIEGYAFMDFMDQYIEDNDPVVFERHLGITVSLGMSYTHNMKYIMEPKRKVLLGSKYPRISINYKKGLNGFLGSAVDFDFISAKIDQNVRLRTLGNFLYEVETGTFLNDNDIRIVDYKRFRRSDPYFFTNPLNSFQILDTALTATRWYVEGHFIHHFNGALVNNIPLVKKLHIYTVAGGGFLWMQENGYRQNELFAGVERIFKIGARRRLRVGVYGAMSESNFAPYSLDWKVSFDIIDTWSTKWNF